MPRPPTPCKVTMTRAFRFRRLVAFVAVLVAVATIAVFVARRPRSSPSADALAAGAEAGGSPTQVVGVYAIGRRSLSKSTTLTAELRPYNVAKLYAKVSGYLSSISVDYGSRVSAGEQVATIQLPEQQAEVARAQSAFALAKVSYGRIVSVVHQTPGMLAQQDVDNARAAFDSARDQLDRAQVMLDYTRIFAPFAGIVTKRDDDVGDLVQQGDTGSSAMPIVEIAQEDRLRLVFEAPVSVVSDIAVGTPVTVKIQGSGRTIRASIARFSSDVHQETRTMHTEVDLDNSDYRLTPGEYADVTLVLADRPDVLAVPTQALSTEGGSNVWIVDGRDRIVQRPVTTGLQTPNWIEVSSGLRAGDRVLLGDRGALSVGERVQPRAAQPVTAS